MTHVSAGPAHGPSRGAKMARGLGWLSVGLAGPPLAVTRRFCAALGLGTGRREQLAAQVVGVRELVSAAGLLTSAGSPWVWSRVAGDTMDLALLGRALRNHDGKGFSRTVAATTAVAAIAAVDLYAALARSREETPVEMVGVVSINREPTQVYRHWRQLENLAAFMAHVEEVRQVGGTMTHWTVRAPFGRTVEWDADITEDEPERRISWRSMPGAAVENSGSVQFTPGPGGHGTEVRVRINYRIPAGGLGKAAARYFGEEPHQQLDDDLRRFKQVMEVGEVIRSEGAPGGKRSRQEFPQHAAQPLSESEFNEVMGR